MQKWRLQDVKTEIGFSNPNRSDERGSCRRIQAVLDQVEWLLARPDTTQLSQTLQDEKRSRAVQKASRLNGDVSDMSLGDVSVLHKLYCCVRFALTTVHQHIRERTCCKYLLLTGRASDRTCASFGLPSESEIYPGKWIV
jgi:hypothetical protein